MTSPPTAPAPPVLHRRTMSVLAGLLIMLAASAHLWTGPAAATGKAEWDWPLLPKPSVTRQYDPPPEPWLSGHRGVDLAAGGGAQVLAPEDGTVSFVGWVVDRPVITIAHQGGLRSSFESVRSALSKGDTVSRGDPIGTVSKPWHCGDAACLHWGVRRGEAYVNPLQFVADLRPSVLLPLP